MRAICQSRTRVISPFSLLALDLTLGPLGYAAFLLSHICPKKKGGGNHGTHTLCGDIAVGVELLEHPCFSLALAAEIQPLLLRSMHHEERRPNIVFQYRIRLEESSGVDRAPVADSKGPVKYRMAEWAPDAECSVKDQLHGGQQLRHDVSAFGW